LLFIHQVIPGEITGEKGKMKFMVKINGQKGESTTYYVVLGFLIAVGLFVVVKYFHDRDNDITVHLPKVEVH
jgi:hypothetical protein